MSFPYHGDIRADAEKIAAAVAADKQAAPGGEAMTAPEQPTPEALAEAKDMLRNFSHDWDMSAGIKAVAARIDRFAAQRAAEADAEIKLLRETMDCLEWLKEKHDAATPPPGDAERDFVEDFVDRAEEAIALMKADTAPPPGDAGERARAEGIAEEIAFDDSWIDLVSGRGSSAVTEINRAALAKRIAAALQSERTAAASQARRETIEVAERSERNHVTAGDSRGAMVAHNIARNIAALAPPGDRIEFEGLG
jgi:hypothetical protein